MVSSSKLQASVKDLDVGFLLDNSRVTITENLPRIDVGSVSLNEMKQGDAVQLSRWIADILHEMRFAQSEEESFEVEMFKALSRERMQGPAQLSTLDKDFYVKMRRFLGLIKSKAEQSSAFKPTYNKMAVSTYDLVALRAGKLMVFSSSTSPPADLADKITPEERILFDEAHNLVSNWRAAVIEGATY